MTLIAEASVAGPSGGTTGNVNAAGSTLFIAYVSELTLGEADVTDSESNVWIPLTPQGVNNAPTGAMFYVANPTASSSMNFSCTGSFSAMCVQAWSGYDAFDDESGINGLLAGGSTCQPGSITPPAAGYLFITGTSHQEGSTPPTITQSFTVGDHIALAGGNNFGVTIAHLEHAAGTALNPMWSNDATTCLMASFAPASGGIPETVGGYWGIKGV